MQPFKETEAPRVAVHNEWDPLEEVIVGRAQNTGVPFKDRSWLAIVGDEEPEGRYPQRAIDEAEEDIQTFIEVLEGLGVVVRRPDPLDVTARVRTPFWEAGVISQYCPRDYLLAVGDTLIETPSPLRGAHFDGLAYKRLFVEYLRGGARWISAPRPALRDALYNTDDPGRLALLDHEPAFDAANVLRAGRDLFYLVSDSGNELGCVWLQSALGNEYRVHPCRDLYSSTHIDTTLVFLRPGLVLVNPKHVREDNLPAPLRQWEVLASPPMEEDTTSELPALSSPWLGMNLLMINPSLAVVDRNQRALIRLLESRGIEVIPLRLRHARAFAGGFHCITLDVRRRGRLEDYFTPAR